jgi:hypothetical protein
MTKRYPPRPGDPGFEAYIDGKSGDAPRDYAPSLGCICPSHASNRGECPVHDDHGRVRGTAPGDAEPDWPGPDEDELRDASTQAQFQHLGREVGTLSEAIVRKLRLHEAVAWLARRLDRS